MALQRHRADPDAHIEKQVIRKDASREQATGLLLSGDTPIQDS